MLAEFTRPVFLATIPARCGVVTAPVVADEWLIFDDAFAVAEGELNDLACFTVALEAVTEF